MFTFTIAGISFSIMQKEAIEGCLLEGDVKDFAKQSDHLTCSFRVSSSFPKNSANGHQGLLMLLSPTETSIDLTLIV